MGKNFVSSLSPFWLIFSGAENVIMPELSPFEILLTLLALSMFFIALAYLINANIQYIFHLSFLFLFIHLFLNNLLYPLNFCIGVMFAGLVAYISNKLRFLTTSGSLATFLLASILFGLGGLKWSVPILSFFILSSIISKLRKRNNQKIDEYFEKSGVRDHWQVLANGGVGGLLIILYTYTQNELFYLLNIASLAAVCADTWATELGTYNNTNTYNIINLKKVTQGRSGGISVKGTFGAILGTIVIAVSGLTWIELPLLNYFVLILSAGVFGSMVDSVIGATIQVQHKCVSCGKVTEKRMHCEEETSYFRGVKLINNDIVNFFASISAIIFIIISIIIFSI
ncbi:MAG: DUF92 domain-containing protein [Bacteroidetes bacterium]|nr:DUF92 domain-containing protein [Bacteroidota bacterium]